MRDACALAAVVVTFGCASAPRARPPISPVEFSEVLPAGYEALGAVHAECRAVPRDSEISDAPVTSLACRESELERALVEQANDRGGTLLAHERCRSGGSHFACDAIVARALAAESPAIRGITPPVPADDDVLPATVASQIVIDVEGRGPRFDRRARAAADVTEFVTLPVGHVELGVVRARCDQDACDERQARAGLRLAAGGLGVSDLVGVRCFALDGERACVATLAFTERDPETDLSAR